MIHAFCDFCGKDCDMTATLLTLTPFQNFARSRVSTDPYGAKGATNGFVICSDCLKKHQLPNPYSKYRQIIAQKLKYDKCLDNYTAEDKKEDAKLELAEMKLLK